MFDSASNWLSNLWIIENNSGICIFEQNFMDIDMNPDLVSGFLIAMLNFGKELAKKDLQMIQFQDLRISFKNYDKYIIAIAVNDDAPESDIDSFHKLIFNEFNTRYSDVLEKWSGNTSNFDEFGDYVEKLINKKALAVELVKSQLVKAVSESEENKYLQEKVSKVSKYIEDKKKELEKLKETSINEIGKIKDSSVNEINKFKEEQIKKLSNLIEKTKKSKYFSAFL